MKYEVKCGWMLGKTEGRFRSDDMFWYSHVFICCRKTSSPFAHMLLKTLAKFWMTLNMSRLSKLSSWGMTSIKINSRTEIEQH